ncbi:MAG TPA: hypothetical protein VN842_01565 [Thermoplasmata archaeon]|nr:hypothetical protein [Thermoplasmata archaeon]
MSGPVYTYPRRLPPLYRLARALRAASLLVLVLLILFTASVVFSTSQLSQTPPRVGSFSVGFGSNGTMILAGSLTLSNPGFYPIQALFLGARVANESGVFLGSFGFGPSTLASGASDEFPLELYLPVSATGPGASLLVHSQYLRIALWGNATFGFIFPAGVSLLDNRSWGAPFSNLAVGVGNLSLNGTVPVSVSFENQASLTEAGTLRAAVVATDGITCGSASWTLNVGQYQQFSQTQPVALSPGCSPAGGALAVEFVTPGYTVPLPPEAIP